MREAGGGEEVEEWDVARLEGEELSRRGCTGGAACLPVCVVHSSMFCLISEVMHPQPQVPQKHTLTLNFMVTWLMSVFGQQVA